MQLKIKYFGVLTEITQCNDERIEFLKSSVSDLIAVLFEKYPELKTKDFQVAQNHEIVSKTSLITETEIALLPPFSGG
jgi:molybdopterin synthase sulfur carrier subunit